MFNIFEIIEIGRVVMDFFNNLWSNVVILYSQSKLRLWQYTTYNSGIEEPEHGK